MKEEESVQRRLKAGKVKKEEENFAAIPVATVHSRVEP